MTLFQYQPMKSVTTTPKQNDKFMMNVKKKIIHAEFIKNGGKEKRNKKKQSYKKSF